MVFLPCKATSQRLSILPLIADRNPSAISPFATTASLVSFRVHCSPSHSVVRLSAVVIVLARRREHLQLASVRNLYSSRLQQSSLVAISPRAISKSVADYSVSLPISAPTSWLVDHAVSVGHCKARKKVWIFRYCTLKKFCVWNAEPIFKLTEYQRFTK